MSVSRKFGAHWTDSGRLVVLGSPSEFLAVAPHEGCWLRPMGHRTSGPLFLPCDRDARAVFNRRQEVDKIIEAVRSGKVLPGEDRANCLSMSAEQIAAG